jgi:death-on-curing protein
MTKIETLAKDTLIRINKEFTNAGIRSDAELDFIVYKAGSARGVNQKAATLLMEIIRKHPFVDGNKRTAFNAMMVFLKANGKELDVGNTSKLNVAFWVVRPKTTVEEIAIWVANHTRW